MKFIIQCLLLASIYNTQAAVDWSSNAILPGNEKCFISHGHQVCFKDGNRENIYNLSPNEYLESLYNGSIYALNYPVEISELQLPKAAMEKYFNSDSNSLIRKFLFRIAKALTRFKSFDELFQWMGLHHYPLSAEETGPNQIIEINNPDHHQMGVSTFVNSHSETITFGCAACHSNNLFGVKVLGLSNRFPKANEIFILGKKALLNSTPLLFKLMVGPSKSDLNTYKTARNAIKYVDLKKPKALGLDTSLAQVGLSLNLRKKDEYATRAKKHKDYDKNHPLLKTPADSKPAVWWNLKYKTKWLSDASIQSGNPVHTNFLWNEIGRGVDLYKLEKWLKENTNKVKSLTSYVFSTKAPRYNDFFPNQINIASAKRGEMLFNNNCMSCHGQYEKNWSAQNSSAMSYTEQIKTSKIWYHKKTTTRNVGTDSHRYKGMNYFAKDLNRLKISKEIGTVVTPQEGYVPPPLVGIWARWPYFHNNSAPTLFDVISLSKNRPKDYIAVPSEDPNTDFDVVKNGYPDKELIKEPYRNDKEYFFNTKIKGLSNKGHDKMLIDKNTGANKFSYSDKLDLIEFLRTL